MPSSFRGEDFQRFCIFFLFVAMATRVIGGIKFFEKLNFVELDPRNIPVKFHQYWPNDLGEKDV